MTTATDEPTTEIPVSDVKTRLRAAAAKRTTKPRRTSTRRTAPVSRNATAARRGKYAPRIVPAIAAGAALLSVRNPVGGAIIARQAEPFAAALDRVAAEDPRVDAFLAKISGVFATGGAWGELGQVTLTTAGAMMLAAGTTPSGPAGMLLAFVAGSLVQEAAKDAAHKLIAANYEQGFGPDRDTWPPIDPAHVARVAAELLAPKDPPPPPEDADEDADEDPADVPGTMAYYEAHRGDAPIGV